MNLEKREEGDIFYLQLRCENKIICKHYCKKIKKCNKKVKIIRVRAEDIVVLENNENNTIHIKKTRENALKRLGIERVLCEECLNETLL